MARPVIEADLEDYLDRIRQLERALLLLWRGRRAPRRVYCALRRARLGQLRAVRVDNVVNGAPGPSAHGGPRHRRLSGGGGRTSVITAGRVRVPCSESVSPLTI